MPVRVQPWHRDAASKVLSLERTEYGELGWKDRPWDELCEEAARLIADADPGAVRRLEENAASLKLQEGNYAQNK